MQQHELCLLEDAPRCSSLGAAYHNVGCTLCGVGSKVWEVPCPTEHASVRRRWRVVWVFCCSIQGLARFEQYMATISIHKARPVEPFSVCGIYQEMPPLQAVDVTCLINNW